MILKDTNRQCMYNGYKTTYDLVFRLTNIEKNDSIQCIMVLDKGQPHKQLMRVFYWHKISGRQISTVY